MPSRDAHTGPRTGSGGAVGQAPLPARAERWALLLDIDGTLFDLVDRPTDVLAGPVLLRLLGRLHRGCEGALALISGRSIADIDRVFRQHPFPAAGQHGLERRDARGRVHRHDGICVALREAIERLRRFEARNPGVLVEDKGASLAVHYRMAPACAEAVSEIMGKVAADLGPQFELLPGVMVLELRPAGRHKGTAIAEFLREPPFRGRTPVFVGDDCTDEHGFRLVNRRGGHTVKVGSGLSVATHRLSDAPGVRRWLARVARLLP